MTIIYEIQNFGSIIRRIASLWKERQHAVQQKNCNGRKSAQTVKTYISFVAGHLSSLLQCEFYKNPEYSQAITSVFYAVYLKPSYCESLV